MLAWCHLIIKPAAATRSQDSRHVSEKPLTHACSYDARRGEGQRVHRCAETKANESVGEAFVAWDHTSSTARCAQRSVLSTRITTPHSLSCHYVLRCLCVVG